MRARNPLLGAASNQGSSDLQTPRGESAAKAPAFRVRGSREGAVRARSTGLCHPEWKGPPENLRLDHRSNVATQSGMPRWFPPSLLREAQLSPREAVGSDRHLQAA